MNQIAKTGFLVSLYSYGVFFLLDVWRPGFVNIVFSVHLFFVAMLFFGIWWGIVAPEAESNGVMWKVMSAVVECIIGCVLALVVWYAGDVFGDMQLVVAFVLLFMPMLVMRGFVKDV